MNLDELRSVRRTERQKDSLQHLRDSFYEDVADYIAQQKAERKRAADRADDPFSDPEVGRLTDEIETAEDVVEAIYERRVGKVVKLASFAAADMSADTNGLTAEERDLFDDLVSRIKQNRETVLDVLAGKRSGSATTTEMGNTSSGGTDVPAVESASQTTPDEVPPADPGTDETPPPPPEVDPEADSQTPTDGAGDVLADAMGDGPGAGDDASARDDTPPTDTSSATPESMADGATATDTAATDSTDGDRPTTEAEAVAAEQPPNDSADSAVEADDTERVTLRITQDVGQILGVDEREYDLATEDVVTLPTTNADPLLERGAAERLD
ncbi:DNA replication complex GINS family protein [Halogeometricum borinquense]|uniref:DNA replication complex GINS family protein n=1 Tax=Halogeometricum borinquense TaxID=60847 RepID=A0A6C0UK07_9EURY|nr:DNA replication complex GINS family protein [Halogeometricum borinquense]QIB74933.1 DNA replication complex GINS family protein [Halogeometricum borinquense]QIQ76067.1 DNA replication complex GINS family protein [Halogeometricum borinquense]